MINPMILNLVSSLLNFEASGSDRSLTSENGGREFLFDMQNALGASLKNSSHMSHDAMKTETASTEIENPPVFRRKGYKHYLESFKKELLAQGRPLNELFLKESDLPLIKKFLVQCGFSPEKIEGFLKDLKAENPGGQISLSHFFQKAAELESPEKQAYQDKIIASSAIPYIESILREFQFAPKELDRVFSFAKVEGGGLDLKKLTAKLKEINAKKPLADKIGADPDLTQKIIAKMEMVGIPIQNKEKIKHISLKDFVAALEQAAGSVNKNDKPSVEIKRTVDGILKRVTPSEQKVSSASSEKILTKYHFTDSLGKNKTNANDAVSSLSGEANAKTDFHKQKDGKVVNHGQLHVNTSNHKERAGLFSALNKKMGSMNPAERESYRVQAETGQMDAPRNTASFNVSDTVKTVEYPENGPRGYLQDSLIEQVGKQISRSILKGDRIVRLRLKPPELGTVEINMDIKDHTLKLGLITEHHAARELLLNNIHELKEALLLQGVKLEKVDVQINHNFGQSLSGSKEGTNNGHGTRKDLDENPLNSDNPAEGASAVPMNILSKSKLLDLVA